MCIICIFCKKWFQFGERKIVMKPKRSRTKCAGRQIVFDFPVETNSLCISTRYEVKIKSFEISFRITSPDLRDYPKITSLYIFHLHNRLCCNSGEMLRSLATGNASTMEYAATLVSTSIHTHTHIYAYIYIYMKSCISRTGQSKNVYGELAFQTNMHLQWWQSCTNLEDVCVVQFMTQLREEA